MHTCCYACKDDSIVVDYAEGIYVCITCGVVQESNIWEYSYNPPDLNIQFEMYEEADTCIPAYILKEYHTLFNELQKEHSFRGNIKKGVRANCLYKICCLYNLPRSIKEISKILDIDTTIITKTSKYVDGYENRNKTKTIQNVDDDFIKMIPRYLNNLSNDIDRIEMTKQLKAFYMNENVLEGKSPHTKMLTFIYHLVGNQYVKKDFCHLFDTSTVTLNKSYKQFSRDLIDL
jgi:transcription initiation factor TFIIIB Brf1 subunit/transcription initiation factor TFIIB